MVIRLVRHGFTAWNQEKRYMGRADLPLSECGKSRLTKDPMRPHRVYVSPLLRCVQTAQALFPEAERIVIAGFREMDFGVFEGRTALEMADDPLYRKWVEQGCLSRCPQGEAWPEFSQRTCDAFCRVMKDGSDPLIIVAHAGTQMAILNTFGPPGHSMWEWPSGNGESLMLEAVDWDRCPMLRVMKKR